MVADNRTMVTNIARKEALCVEGYWVGQKALSGRAAGTHLKHTLELGMNAILPSYGGLQGWVASPRLPLWPLQLPLSSGLAARCTGLLVAPQTTPNRGYELCLEHRRSYGLLPGFPRFLLRHPLLREVFLDCPVTLCPWPALLFLRVPRAPRHCVNWRCLSPSWDRKLHQGRSLGSVHCCKPTAQSSAWYIADD